MSSSGVSACPLVSAGSSTARTLAAGQSCLLPISFTPTTSGNLTGTLALTDNALNAAASAYAKQSIPLSGIGTKASQTINFAAPASLITYGVSPITLSATATSNLAVTFSATGPATISGSILTITGAGSVVVTASQAGNGSYAAAPPISYTITVNPAVLTVTANNVSRAYGATNPTFTDTITGFVNGDTSSVVSGTPSLTTTATSASTAGSYPITASGTLTATNYSFSYVNGTLTVTTAAQTVNFTALPSPVIYGVSPITLSATASSGLAVTFSVVSGPGTVNGSTLTITGAGTVVVAANKAGNTNYAAATQVTQSVVVNKATLTVTAANATRTYGAANPTFTDTITGFVNGDTSSVVSGTPSMMTTATPTSAVGTYPITTAVGTLAAANYSFSYVNGTLIVVKNALVLPASGNIATVAGGGTVCPRQDR